VTRNAIAPAQLYPGLGDGTFADPIALPFLPGWESSVATGDIDADGDQDLLWLQSASGDPSYALNDGTGLMTDQGTLVTTAASGVIALRLRDFTGDGLVDVVLASRRGVYVQAADGAGGFEPEVFYASTAFLSTMKIVDLDGDGLLDVVGHGYDPPNLGRKYTLAFFNNGGALELPIRLYGHIYTDPIDATLDAADFDGDGLPDLLTVVRNSGNAPRLLSIGWNLGARRFTPPTFYGIPGTITNATAVNHSVRHQKLQALIET